MRIHLGGFRVKRQRDVVNLRSQWFNSNIVEQTTLVEHCMMEESQSSLEFGRTL